MSSLKVSVSHSLGQDMAVSRIKNLLGELKKEFSGQISDVKENWEGNKNLFSLKVMGLNIDGDIIVGQNDVTLNGNLPITAVPFKGMIEDPIKDKMQILLV
ncbi:MAG: polyhydroxyalkanoic acid system family protein [Ignavibacteria bacterium]